MKNTLKQVCAALFVVLCVQSAQAYRDIQIVVGKRLPFRPTYEVSRGYKRYAVKLDPRTKRYLERMLSGSTDQEFNKRITKSTIRRITAGCSESPELCATVEKVLYDFLGRQLEVLFTELGLRREI